MSACTASPASVRLVLTSARNLLASAVLGIARLAEACRSLHFTPASDQEAVSCEQIRVKKKNYVIF